MNGAELEDASVIPAIEKADGVADCLGALAFDIVAKYPGRGAKVLGFEGAAVIAFNRDHNRCGMRGRVAAVCRLSDSLRLDIFRQGKLD